MIIAEGRGVSVIFVCKKKENCLLRRSPTTTTSVPSIDLSSYYVMLLLGEPKEFDIVREWASPSAGGRSRTTVKKRPQNVYSFFLYRFFLCVSLSTFVYYYFFIFFYWWWWSPIHVPSVLYFFLTNKHTTRFSLFFFFYIYIYHTYTHTHTHTKWTMFNKYIL